MEKEKVIDLVEYRDNKNAGIPAHSFISEELKLAIQSLIYRLKEEGPI